MKFKTEKQVVEESKEECFQSCYQSVLNYIEKYLGINLEIIEKAAIKQNLVYIMETCSSPWKFDKAGSLDSISSSNPTLGLESLLLYVKTYGIEFGDVWYNGNQPWFKQEFRRREECLML